MQILLFALALGATALIPRGIHDARPVLEAIAPALDEALRSQGYDGTVRIEVMVDASGSVTSARVLDSFVPNERKEFEETLISCAEKWKFEPASESSTESILFVFKYILEGSTTDVLGVLFKAPATMEVRAIWPDLVEFVDPVVKK